MEICLRACVPAAREPVDLLPKHTVQVSGWVWGGGRLVDAGSPESICGLGVDRGIALQISRRSRLRC